MSYEKNQSYQPTCLEWVTLELNARYSMNPPPPLPTGVLTSNPPNTPTSKDLEIYFDGEKEVDTVTIVADLPEGTDESIMDEYLEGLKEKAEKFVANLGWDSWISIKINQV